jgi:hypothetical protein
MIDSREADPVLYDEAEQAKDLHDVEDLDLMVKNS